jgi:hypothetical protein
MYILSQKNPNDYVGCIIVYINFIVQLGVINMDIFQYLAKFVLIVFFFNNKYQGLVILTYIHVNL